LTEDLLRTANEGQILRRGIRAAIIGRPNAGKSSLLNQLLSRDRAIVSAIPGTTRDTIEETANIRGLPVVLIDTAGLRDARDEVEVEGVRRSRESLDRAEFILHVLDASNPLTAADEAYLKEFAEKKRILVRNKADLPSQLQLPDDLALNVTHLADATPGTGTVPHHSAPSPGRGNGSCQNEPLSVPNAPVVDVSCLTGEGIEALKDAIKELAWSGQIRAEMLEVMINSRHQEALERARSGMLRAAEALRADAPLELAALDLRLAANAVGEIIGKTTTEDLLDMIFSRFCIGK
jgi:tRNA modification GTPase